MAKRRAVSLTAKMTTDDYRAIVRKAAPLAPGTWAHEVMLRALNGPDQIEVTLLAEVLALSRLVTNVIDLLARKQPLTQQIVRELKERAGQDKREMAAAVLQEAQ